VIRCAADSSVAATPVGSLIPKCRPAQNPKMPIATAMSIATSTITAFRSGRCATTFIRSDEGLRLIVQRSFVSLL
jgi:hypothetical protein